MEALRIICKNSKIGGFAPTAKTPKLEVLCSFKNETVSVAVYGYQTHRFRRRIRLYNREKPYSLVAIYGDGTLPLWNGWVSVQKIFTRSATHLFIGLLPVLLILSTVSPISCLGLLLLQRVFVIIFRNFQFWFTKILGAISELLGNRRPIIGIGWYKVIFIAKFGCDITIPINGVLSEGGPLHIWSDRSSLAYMCLLLGLLVSLKTLQKRRVIQYMLLKMGSFCRQHNLKTELSSSNN